MIRFNPKQPQKHERTHRQTHETHHRPKDNTKLRPNDPQRMGCKSAKDYNDGRTNVTRTIEANE